MESSIRDVCKCAFLKNETFSVSWLFWVVMSATPLLDFGAIYVVIIGEHGHFFRGGAGPQFSSIGGDAIYQP